MPANLIITGVMMAISMAMQMKQAQAAKKKQASAKAAAAAAEAVNKGLKFNTRSTSVPLRVLYGRHRIGGNEVYFGISGPNNNILWIVDTYSEGPCSAIYQVGGVDQLFLDGKIYTQFGGKATYYFHNGAADQVVDPYLASALPEWTDRNKLVCYGVWKLEYDENYFQGLPDRNVILNARTLYDPRTSTTGWSRNPVLVEWDFRTNTLYGLGESTSILDETTFEGAATYCDTKGWIANLVYDRSKSAQDFLDEINLHMRGDTVLSNGIWYKKYFDLNYESACPAITDEHIRQDDSGKAMIRISQPSRYSKPDGLSIHIIDPDKEYGDDYFPVGEEIGQIEDLDLYGATRQQAGDIGIYTLERMRIDRSISGSFRDDCARYECGDVVPLTSSALAISGQYVRIVEKTIQEDGIVDMGFEYETLDLYDLVYNVTGENTYTCTLPDPSEIPPEVSNPTITEEYNDWRLRTATKLKIDFDPPNGYPWFDHVDVYLSFDNATWEYMFPAKTSFEIPNVEEGRTYYIRLKSVSKFGPRQTDNADVKLIKTVLGYVDVPESLGSLQAVVNANCVNLYSQKVADTDIELYEFRLGTSWTGGIFMGAFRSPNLSLYGVKPGTHSFLANTLSNNGEYGSNPQVQTVVLSDPPDGWTLQRSHNITYPSGEHYNTQWIDYSDEKYLKCPHSGSVLSGEYISHIIDIGASDRYMIYALAEVAITGSGTTWNDVMSGSTTWDQIGISTRSWAQIFQLPNGPNISIKLKYGDASPPMNEVDKLEILSTVVSGRYFQLKVNITDPSVAVFALLENMTLKFCQ